MITTAASVASGRLVNSGIMKSNVRIARMPLTTWLICVFPPAPIATDVFDRLPAATNPELKPAPRLAVPRATNS